MIAESLEPLEPYPGLNEAWRSRCTRCQQIVFPRLSNVRHGSSCRFCANHGLDWAGPAIVYLIRNRAKKANKIGVTGISTLRLADHKRAGFELIHTIEMTTGNLAYLVEQAVKARLINEFGADMPFLSKSDLPQRGYTETFAVDVLSDPALLNLITQEAERISEPVQ